MKTKVKVLFLLLASSLVALAAWLVHVPDTVHADDVPEKYRDTVKKGLEYLAKNQCPDGHWEGDDGKHPVAMTGLVGLALLMEGSATNELSRAADKIRRMTTYDSVNIRKAVDWLIDQSKAGRDGLIFSEHPSETTRYMEGHGLATLFLAAAFMDEPDNARRKKINDILTGAVKYIGNARSSQGGWYHTSRAEGHDLGVISVTCIQIQALQAAEIAGIPVPDEAVSHAREYLKMALAKYKDGAGSGQNPGRTADTAAAVACCFPNKFTRRQTVDELGEKWFKYCQAEIPMGRDIKFGRDELVHYYYAQALFSLDIDDAWNTYRTAMFDHLQSSQKKDGSWPASDDIGVGPVYATALWCTVLQLDKRSHPLLRYSIAESLVN
jgi:hypothetical protein